MARPASKPERPKDGRVHELQVLRSARVSSSFVRVTIGGDAEHDDAFRHVGHDQWFRLFLPNSEGALGLPGGTGDGWYRRWLMIPRARRSVVRNYTIRQARHVGGRWEIDVDFVVHAGPSGQVDGPAAAWALAARPGDRLGFLDQGMMFAPVDAEQAAADGGRVWLVADETGLPGVEGILASVGGAVEVGCLLEVPHDDDRRELVGAADVRWLVRGEHGERPGRAALAAATALRLGRSDYLYAVGESSMTVDVRRLAKRAGLPKERVDVCAYWRPERRAA